MKNIIVTLIEEPLPFASMRPTPGSFDLAAILEEDKKHDLTADQMRKPLKFRPVRFRRMPN